MNMAALDSMPAPLPKVEMRSSEKRCKSMLFKNLTALTLALRPTALPNLTHTY